MNMANMGIVNIFLAGILGRHILRQVAITILVLPMAVACSSQGTLSNKSGNSADNSALARAGCQPRKHAILPAILLPQLPPS